ncbi:MAG: nitrilase-related carbon-nitrogen hydrolase, partial [Alphaproteobacteria bacterium]
MTDRLRIGIAQINPVVGDIRGNVEKVKAASAKVSDCDLIVFPELVISGYPPEDLVMKPAFAAYCRAATEALAKDAAGGPALLVGTPWPEGG